MFSSKPPADGWPHAGLTTRGRGQPAVELALDFTTASDMLLGLTPMPTGRLPGQLSSAPAEHFNTRQAAAVFVHGAKPVWERHPGAVEWFAKVFNTCNLWHALQGISVAGRPPALVDEAAAVAAIRAGTIFSKALISEGLSLLHCAAYGKAANTAVLRALLEAGASPLPPTAGPTPLMTAAYFCGDGVPLENTAVLLAATPRPPAGVRDAVRWEAAGMATEQGNAEARRRTGRAASVLPAPCAAASLLPCFSAACLPTRLSCPRRPHIRPLILSSSRPNPPPHHPQPLTDTTYTHTNQQTGAGPDPGRPAGRDAAPGLRGRGFHLPFPAPRHGVHGV